MARAAGELSVGSECVPNIGLRGRRRRLFSGIAMTALTLAVFWALAVRHASATSFLLVAPFAGIAALYLFEVKEQTCVVLAALRRQEQEGSTRHARMAEEWLVAVQRQARKVWIETLVATLVVTSAALLYASLR